jgi:hypothetical protein
MLKFGLKVVLAMLVLAATGCTWRSGQTEGPSYIRKFPSDLSDQRLELDGIYADGWTAPKASLSLVEPRGQQVLVIRGLIPKIDRDDFRTDVELSLDDKVVAKKSVGLGNFSLEARIPPSPGKHRVSLYFASVQLLPNGDYRPIGTRLSFAGFEAASKTRAGSALRSDSPNVKMAVGTCCP